MLVLVCYGLSKLLQSVLQFGDIQNTSLVPDKEVEHFDIIECFPVQFEKGLKWMSLILSAGLLDLCIQRNTL